MAYTMKELTIVYGKIRDLCRAYDGRTNVGYKALSIMTGVDRRTVRYCINALIECGALDCHIDDNHFLPNEISMGWDGSGPHKPQTRYYTLPKST